MSCGVGRRHGSDPGLLWLWYRSAAVAPIGPLAWELPYASGVALKSKKQTQKIKICLKYAIIWHTMVYNTRMSPFSKVVLKDSTYYIVQIKSSTPWRNYPHLIPVFTFLNIFLSFLLLFFFFKDLDHPLGLLDWARWREGDTKKTMTVGRPEEVPLQALWSVRGDGESGLPHLHLLT